MYNNEQIAAIQNIVKEMEKYAYDNKTQVPFELQQQIQQLKMITERMHTDRQLNS